MQCSAVGEGTVYRDGVMTKRHIDLNDEYGAIVGVIVLYKAGG